MGIKSYAFGLSSDVQANCQWLFGGKRFASLLCGANKDKHGKLIDNCLVPYSFRIEDISSDKFGELYEVDFIFCKQTNDSTYSTLSYKGNKEIEEIPEEIRAKISESIK